MARSVRPRATLRVFAAGLCLAAALGLGACSGSSARSDYYTVRGFFVQPSTSPAAIAAAPLD